MYFLTGGGWEWIKRSGRNYQTILQAAFQLKKPASLPHLMPDPSIYSCLATFSGQLGTILQVP